MERNSKPFAQKAEGGIGERTVDGFGQLAFNLQRQAV